jgi:hypothetical protein
MAAKVCPYCGANPDTGERVDTQAILQEIFQPREVSATENVIEYARQRQGIVIAGSIFVLFLLLAGLHQYVTARNNSEVSGAPAIPLTELTDVTRREDTAPVKMPEIEFQYDGRPQSMRTFIAERGAVPPPEVVAAQQAAQLAAQQQKAAAAVQSKPAPAAGTRPAAAPAPARPQQPQPALPAQNTRR